MKKEKLLLPAVFLFALLAFAGSAEAKAGNGIQLKNAVISSIDRVTETITAEKDGTAYTIDASSATFRRKYGAKCDVYEFEAGDYIWVWGTMSGTSITARKVKDYSIQKWKGSFVGTITTVDSATYSDNEGRGFQQIEIESRRRGDQVIRIYGTTSLKYRGASKSFSDLAVGQEIVAKGIWNSTHSFVFETDWLKIRKLAD